MKRALLGIVVLVALVTVPGAQMRVVPLDDEQGHVALGLALRHLSNTGVLMMNTAHPDDENNGLLVLLNRGEGVRTALVTATRGNGGQNEIGPEIFEALGILRTEELGALHRFDGAEQYFTRAVDFGYSFSIDETLEKWGKDEITSDFVRLVRTIRPDVMVGMRPDGAGGGQHHQTSAILSRAAWGLAGDATKYPDQVKDGLRAWQPRKYYFMGRFGFPGEAPLPPDAKLITINLAGYDSLLGKTCAEIGTEGRSMHKCQGMAQLLALPGPATTSYQLVESGLPGGLNRPEKSLFDGIDTTIAGLARFAGPKPPKDVTEGLSVISTAVQTAQKKFDAETDEATVQPLLAGLYAVRVLRRELRSMNNIDEAGRFDLDFRLRQKEVEFQRAALIANGIQVEALANDGVVVPGQQVRVAAIIANHGADVTVKQVKFGGFDGEPACTLRPVTQSSMMRPGGRNRDAGAEQTGGTAVSVVRKDAVVQCDVTATIPANARATEPYWHRQGEAGRYTFDSDAPFGLPFRPTPFYVQVTMAFPNGEEVIDGLPIEYRYQGNIFSGEKRSELLVVPALSVRMTPHIAIIPSASVKPAAPTPTSATRTRAGRAGTAAAPATKPGAATKTAGGGTGKAGAASTARPAAADRAELVSDREVRVTVVNDSPAAVESVVKLDLPEGWTATPSEQPVNLAREDDSQTVRFAVHPGTNAAPGEYHVKAIATANGQSFGRGFTTIEYPHIHRRHIFAEADTTMKVVDVRTAPNLTVGYIVGVGDEVPPAIEQLGAKVELLGPENVAWGDLSKYDAIVTGVRAYERREDLRANNNRLLEYVQKGGTMIVQYNKFEFNEAQYGPYPAKVSSDRVTDEFSPVTVLEPSDPLVNSPNKLGDATWKGWVQERGLYFLGEKDSRYHDLLQLEDPFPYNKGPKLGSLVEASYGRGRWVYVGLNLWRQLPAGTDGAYQILANLISLGKTTTGAKPATPAPVR